jgi:hypothetical protein
MKGILANFQAEMGANWDNLPSSVHGTCFEDNNDCSLGFTTAVPLLLRCNTLQPVQCVWGSLC